MNLIYTQFQIKILNITLKKNTYRLIETARLMSLLNYEL